jgi:hypothetical protein
LRDEITRGREYLEQVRGDLAAARARLEEWTTYERVCGKNPVLDYLQNIEAKERLEQFLPGWVERREQQLATLDNELERCARQNGLQHLL